MNRKMYWGLGVLILLIGIVGLYFILQPDPEPEKVFLPTPIEDPTVAAEPQQPAKPGFKWVRHGDHYHQVKITEPTEPKIAESDKADTVSWLKMSPEQLKEAFSKLSYAEKEFLDFLEMSPEACVEWFSKLDDAKKQFFYQAYREERKRLAAYREEWGEDPPPIGANWQHKRNLNGETLRHYKNTVTIFYRDGIGFAPTLEQWKQHEALQTELAEAQRRGDTAEWDRVSAQLETLIASAQGPVPFITGGLYSGDDISAEEEERKRDEAIREVYRKFGIEHTLQQLGERPMPTIVE